jgi:hypothetical protein
VGKSRLHWEFTRSHHADGWLVLRSRSVAYARGTPYLQVIELLETYLGLQERADPRRVRERVADKLLTLDRTLEPLLTPLLGPSIGVGYNLSMFPRSFSISPGITFDVCDHTSIST